jgi:hypothetical protein
MRTSSKLALWCLGGTRLGRAFPSNLGLRITFQRLQLSDNTNHTSHVCPEPPAIMQTLVTLPSLSGLKQTAAFCPFCIQRSRSLV